MLCNVRYRTIQGRIQRSWKGVALYVGHHCWPTKKILGFRWSKKGKITLETISFWQNISISIFKFSLFYAIKACQWNLISFSKFEKRFDKEREKNSYEAGNEKRKTDKSWTLFYDRLFCKVLCMIINHFFVLQAYSQPNFCFLIPGWRKKYQKGK